MNNAKKVVLYSTDIMSLLDCSRTTANNIIRDIKGHGKKGKKRFVSVDEFCKKVNVPEEHVFNKI